MSLKSPTYPTGYTGKGIKVDLTKKEITVFDAPEELYRKYLGGRGIGVAIIADRITHTYDSAEIPLIFATGPLVGTPSPTSGRMSVISRSPLTGTVFDCSVGGRFGTELKKAGYDYIEITGISDRWVALNIENSSLQIEDASKLSGKNISEVATIFDKKGSYAAIGRSGEAGVRFASIVFDGHHRAGRGGLGAVMGAKMLKAIRVKGDGKVSVADPDRLKDAHKEIMRLLRASQAIFGEFGLSEFGTAALVDLIHVRRMEPTENFRKTFFPHSHNYSGYNINTILLSEPSEPYRSILKEIINYDPVCIEEEKIVPLDCETRTFFHDIPVIDDFSLKAIGRALSHRKAVIIRDKGIVTYGIVTPEQAFVSFSSVCFSTFVKYFFDTLMYLRDCSVKKWRLIENLLTPLRAYLSYRPSTLHP